MIKICSLKINLFNSYFIKFLFIFCIAKLHSIIISLRYIVMFIFIRRRFYGYVFLLLQKRNERAF